MLAPHYIWAANLYLLNLSQYLKMLFFFFNVSQRIKY